MNQPSKSAQESGAEKTKSAEIASAPLEKRQASVRVASPPANVRTVGDIVVSKEQKNGPLAAATPDSLAAPVPGSITPAMAQTTAIKAYAHRSRSGMLWSMFICVVIPVIVSTVYFGWIATDQFLCTAEYIVKTPGGNNSAVGANGVSLMKQALGQVLPNMGGLEQSIIVGQYIQSVQIIDDMKPYIDVRKLYSDPKINWLSRLNPNASEADLLLYWRSMVKLHQDATQGYSELIVRAFTPQDAKAISDCILKLSEVLVNRLAARAHAAAMEVSKKAKDASEERLNQARTVLQEFQKNTREINPETLAMHHGALQSDLERDISNCRAQLENLRRDLPEDAPSVRQLAGRLVVLESQLKTEKKQSTSPTPGVFSFTAPGVEPASKGPDDTHDSELDGCRSKLALLRQSLPEDAPAIVQLTKRIALLESQAAGVQPVASGEPAAQNPPVVNKSPGEIAIEYAGLTAEVTFAQQLYLATVTSFQNQEFDEMHHTTYLQDFLPARVPDTSEYPKRFRSVIFTFLVCGVVWGLGSLFVSVAKEHL